MNGDKLVIGIKLNRKFTMHTIVCHIRSQNVSRKAHHAPIKAGGNDIAGTAAVVGVDDVGGDVES